MAREKVVEEGRGGLEVGASEAAVRVGGVTGGARAQEAGGAGWGAERNALPCDLRGAQGGTGRAREGAMEGRD